MAKDDYPSLVAPGFHRMTLVRLRELCVDSIPDSATRKRLMDNLDTVVEKIVSAHLPCSLWIDGSFLTEKNDPSDVDIALLVDSATWTGQTDEIRSVLRYLESNELSEQLRIDARIVPVFAPDDPMFDLGRESYRYWFKKFGTGHDNETPKGIATMQFSGGITHVPH